MGRITDDIAHEKHVIRTLEIEQEQKAYADKIQRLRDSLPEDFDVISEVLKLKLAVEQLLMRR